jgi:two-component system, OmpR family, sensor kinase
MRKLRERHRLFHRQHDFRLQRALFWWFGLTILMTSCVSFGVMRLVSPDAHSWRKDTERLQLFAADRFAKVWDDAQARHELMVAVSQAFDAAVRVKDSSGRDIDAVGGECKSRSFTIDVTRGGHTLGTVSGCLRQYHGPNWLSVGATLFAAFVTIWAATAKLTRRLTRPLQDLTRVTRELGEGKLESRVRLGHHHRGEVGILAESINEMAKRIERQLNDQRELLAGVSHEIRSPLARLRVLAELLQSGSASPGLHQKIELEVAEIDDLVGKLLASSRLDFGALELSNLCARDIAERALTRAGLATARLADTSEAVIIRGDATLLARALGNLLENAEHHAGGIDRLALRADAGHVYFEVMDRGPGLSTEALAHGFDPFFRGRQDGQTSSRGALGLGLSLVRRIARAHGGDASIDNRRDGAGAIATLTLPRAASAT